ncbi:MAG TPA: hypothetical protein VH300_16075 [Thermoleophilaceae bacterium]|jgi:hypothetical protein|nr:hypothetical protein [Thermoleophilaceae bacterium]
MKAGQSRARHQSRPNRRFLRRLPAAVAAAALIAAGPAYGVVKPIPVKPVGAARAAAHVALPAGEISSSDSSQTTGSNR